MDSVLLVDDSRTVRTMARDMLSDGGWQVIEAGTAAEALERMREHPHNVVVLDVVLPDCNGIDLLKDFAREWPTTKVVMMSAHSSTDLAVRAIERGAYDFVTKPLRREELLITVRKALDNFWLSHQRDLLIDKLNRKIERLEMFEGISKIISSTLDLQHLIDLSIQITRDLIPAELYRFVVAGGEDREPASFLYELQGEDLVQVAEGPGKELADEVLRVGRPGRHRPEDDAPSPGGGLRGSLAVPLRHKGRVLGVLQVVNRFETDAGTGTAGFDGEDRELLSLLASHLATAISNALLTEELRSSKEQIESYSRNLERMVWERTQDLEQANENLRSTNRRLQQAQSRLIQQEKMASIGQLAAGVAHEINNPLAFIASNMHTLDEYLEGFRKLHGTVRAGGTVASGLLDETALDLEDVGEIIQDCCEGTRRMEKIVRSLKDFSHADREEPEEADINAEVEKALKLVWNHLKYKAKVDIDLGDTPPLVCHPTQLGQVLVNLLVNASHAIEDSGRIEVKTRLEGDEIVVTVSDDGCGIPDDVLGRIFDPFFTTKEVGEGTGLGLSVSYGIVERHGGRIEVDTEPGEGTTFRLHLPVNGVGRIEEEATSRASA